MTGKTACKPFVQTKLNGTESENSQERLAAQREIHDRCNMVSLE
jgi:hypothetical protein